MKTKSIKNIKVGDYVQSYNHKKDQLVSAKVTKTFKHKDVPGVKLVINKDLTATGNHPLYINGEYKPAARAKVGDIVVNPDGIEIKIHTLALKPMKIDVYNIEVEGDHNYFAGGLLNHNKCGIWEGDDVTVEKARNTLKDKSRTLWEESARETRNYFRVKAETIGAPTSTDFVSLGSGIDDDVDTTDIDESLFSFIDEEGSAQNISIPGWQTTHGGYKTDWGEKLDDFFGANDAYQTALQDAANATIAAETTLETATSDVVTSLEEGGGEIAAEAEGALQDVESATAAMGFAASGAEEEMKGDVRRGSGEAWATTTSSAQSSLQSALDDYAGVMGDADAATVDVSGQELGNLGSVQTNLNTAYDNFTRARKQLDTDISIIQSSLDKGFADYEDTLGAYKSTFETAYTTIQSTVGAQDAAYAIPQMSEITGEIESSIGAYIGHTGDTEFTYESMKGINTPTYTDPTDWGETGSWSSGQGGGTNFLYMGRGEHQCLEGNVKVVMGDKNASK
jgi:hypothetical protein